MRPAARGCSSCLCPDQNAPGCLSFPTFFVEAASRFFDTEAVVLGAFQESLCPLLSLAFYPAILALWSIFTYTGDLLGIGVLPTGRSRTPFQTRRSG